MIGYVGDLVTRLLAIRCSHSEDWKNSDSDDSEDEKADEALERSLYIYCNMYAYYKYTYYI